MGGEIGYTPSPWGAAFHALPHDEALGAGAAGVGKTRVLVMDPMAQIITEHARCRDRGHAYPMKWGDSVGQALHLRRTVGELEQTIAYSHSIFPKVDPEAHWYSGDDMWEFASGYKFRFGHCKDRDSWTRYLGWELTHLSLDELITFEEEQYDQLGTRVRTDDPVLALMLRIRSMSNPMMPSNITIAVKNPEWVRQRFIDPAPEGKVTLVKETTTPSGKLVRRTSIYYPGTLYDNPNKDFVAQYEARLALSPRHIREALLYGNWYFTQGAFFGDVWEKSMHVCAPFKIPDDWPVFRSMDWGYKQPGCVLWWTMDGDENIICIKEVTFQGKDVEEVAKTIEQVEREMGLWDTSTPFRQSEPSGRSRIGGPADTQLWEDRGDIGLSKAAVMEKWGVRWSKAQKHTGGHNNRGRKVNADKLIFRLKDRRGGVPGILFFRSCQMCIRTIPMIQTDPHFPDQPLDGGSDHWLDAVLYACAYASYGRSGVASRAKVRGRYDEDFDDEAAGGIDRGRDGYGGRV